MSTVTFKGTAVQSNGNLPEVGSQAPEFKLVGAGLNEISLADYKGKKVLLNIFPSIDTGVCAASVRNFNKWASSQENVVVICVSKDLPFAQSRFCAAEGLVNIKTISDHKDLDFGEKYGFVIKELRLLARGTVVIDKSGIVRYVEFVPEVTNEPDYEAALAVVKGF